LLPYCQPHRSIVSLDETLAKYESVQRLTSEAKTMPSKDTSLPDSHTDLKTIGRVSCPFYAAFRIVVQAFNNSPRFVLNSRVVHTPEQM
jgi:hypothetical protein